jgi:hypothetical protein
MRPIFSYITESVYFHRTQIHNCLENVKKKLTAIAHSIKQHNNYVRFEVLTAVVKRNFIFWDMTPCSPLKVDPTFSEEHAASFFRVE